MRASAENFKGIKYVRISTLPVDQKNLIWKSINQNLIIKILRDDALLNDCLQYDHYVNWYEAIFKLDVQEKSVEIETPGRTLAIAS